MYDIQDEILAKQAEGVKFRLEHIIENERKQVVSSALARMDEVLSQRQLVCFVFFKK